MTKPQSSKAPKDTKTKKPAKPRLTASERRALEQEKDRRAEVQRQQELLEFNLVRPQRWVELWAKALHLWVLMREYPGVEASHEWWFNYFFVDAKAKTFTTDGCLGQAQSEQSIEPRVTQVLHEELDRALAWIAHYELEQERKRQEALNEAQKRKQALTKLTDEDKKVLGLA